MFPSGVTELLQREYQITVAGPSTMAALLNARRWGFPHAGDPSARRGLDNFKVAKTEFGKFGAACSRWQPAT